MGSSRAARFWESRRPPGPPASYLLSRLRTRLGRCTRWPAASSTDRLCTRNADREHPVPGLAVLLPPPPARPPGLFPFGAVHTLPARDQIHVLFVWTGCVLTNWLFTMGSALRGIRIGPALAVPENRRLGRLRQPACPARPCGTRLLPYTSRGGARKDPSPPPQDTCKSPRVISRVLLQAGLCGACSCVRREKPEGPNHDIVANPSPAVNQDRAAVGISIRTIGGAGIVPPPPHNEPSRMHGPAPDQEFSVRHVLYQVPPVCDA